MSPKKVMQCTFLSMSNRYQYVSIDTIKSDVIECPPCSIIQGSKHSALLYTLYINEVAVLQNLMESELYTKLTGFRNEVNKNGIEHNTIHYILIM